MNSQEELLTGEGEEVGDGRAEGSSANRDEGASCKSAPHLTVMGRRHIFESLQLEDSA